MRYGISMILPHGKPVNVLSNVPKHLPPRWKKAAVYMCACHSWGENLLAEGCLEDPLLHYSETPSSVIKFHVPLTDVFPGS